MYIHRFHAAVFLAASSLFFGFAAAHGQNLLNNGSFEINGGQNSTTGTGWQFLNNACYVNTEGSTDGSYAAAFNRGSLTNTGVVYQTVTGLLTGHVYQVAFDYGNQGILLAQQLGVNVRDGSAYNAGSLLINPGSATISATSGGSIVTNGTLLMVADGTASGTSNNLAGSNPEFNRVTFDFTAQSSSSTLVFNDAGTLTLTSDLIVDNVMLGAEVPEPATWVGGAVLSVCSFLTARRFRRSRKA